VIKYAEQTNKQANKQTNKHKIKQTNMRSDDKVCKLTTVCLPWLQLTETSIWFDDVRISSFHSYVVVYLWQSLSEWRLLLSECVFGVPS
jgi:hypothetical protein